jgi:hypothetical protein
MEKGKFAEELNELITRHLKAGFDPRNVVDGLTREANLVFDRYDLEIYFAARPKT